MYLLEGVEQVSGQGIAVTVLQDNEPATVGNVGANLCQLGVASHESAVCQGTAVLELLEELLLVRTANGDNLIVLVHLVLLEGCLVHGLQGLVVDEVLGGVLYGNVLGIAIHGTYEAAHRVGLVIPCLIQGMERHFCHLGKLPGGIVCPEGRPVVVGAQIYVLAGMLAKHGIYVHGMHGRIQMAIDIAYGGRLVLAHLLHLLGHIEGRGRGHDHTVDVHTGEGLHVLVAHVGIGRTCLGTASEAHEGTHVLVATYYHDTGIGNLGLLVCRKFVDISPGIASVVLGNRFFCLHALCLGKVGKALGGGMVGDVVVAKPEHRPVLHHHGEGHEVVAEGLGVGKPLAHRLGIVAAPKAIEREGGEGGKVALLQFRVAGTRKGIKHQG